MCSMLYLHSLKQLTSAILKIYKINNCTNKYKQQRNAVGTNNKDVKTITNQAYKFIIHLHFEITIAGMNNVM